MPNAHARTHAEAMDGSCKACGERQLESKGRRPLKGVSYSALFEISSEITDVATAEVHKLLASSPSYVCKNCYSTLVKYASIGEHIKRIKVFLTTKFSARPGTVSYRIDEHDSKVYTHNLLGT